MLSQRCIIIMNSSVNKVTMAYGCMYVCMIQYSVIHMV